jgi:hypothetical protein
MTKRLYKKITCAIAMVLALASVFSLCDNGITSYAVNKKTSQIKTANTYIVSQDGLGDFTTIQAGVDAAQSGDTLLICPGTYDEIVTVTDKELNLTGTSKELCIIRSDSVSYRQAPLSIAAGTVSNLTIYGMYTGNDNARNLTQSQIEELDASMPYDSWERQQNYRGYAVHVDQNCLYGKSLTFENCIIYSENSHCIGIGSRGESSININNCELIALGEGGCIYMHDSPLAEVGGEAHLNITNSSLTSYLCPYILTLESILPDVSTTYFTFQNVKASAVAFSDNTSYVANNVNTFFDVETLEKLNAANLLTGAGYTTTAAKLVNHLERQDTIAYMTMLEESLKTGDTTKVRATKLNEGITYISDVTTNKKTTDKKTTDKTATAETTNSTAKHQVIAIYNSDNLSGDGWLGLDSAILTSDSFGNTLVEMNYPILQ